jgi:DNA-binding ferritin-like protein (Dps family)
MATIKETQKVKDFTDAVKGVTGLVKENYLNGVELASYIWEENLKVLNAQVNQLLDLQQEIVKAGRELYDNFPKEVATYPKANSVDRFVALQKEYIESVRKVSDKFTKETLNLVQKNVEKAFSIIDDYIGLFRV